MKALVVDDSAVMRKILVEALGLAGISDVAEVESGADGVSAAKDGGYDLAVVALEMADMRGEDAVRAMREAGQAFPIMMVTSEADKPGVIDAIKAGATNYVVKPVDTEAMKGKLQGMMEKAGKPIA